MGAHEAEYWKRHNLIIGRQGEAIAAKFLQERGLRILERNYETVKGEIDLIAQDGNVLVFCEVKTREDLRFGPPECAVTAAKQLKLRRSAAVYLYERGIEQQECRFDVVAILLRNGEPDITYLPNAFYL